MAKRKIDFTGVESFVLCEEGKHTVRVKEVEDKRSQNGNDMYSFKYEVVNGISAGATLYDNCVITEKALWKLKSVLSALGVKADGKIVVDSDKLVGKTCIVSVNHEEYNGRTQARVGDYFKIQAEEVDEDDDIEEDIEEEEEKPKKKPAKKPKKEEPEDEEDDWEDV